MALLDQPLSGFYFTLSPSSPRPSATIIGLGYSLGEGLGFNQGHVLSTGSPSGIPVIVMSLLGAEGSSGGPILNASGYVVGLTQQGATSSSSSTIRSLDIARFTRGRAALLCQGAAAGQPSTLCGNATSTSTPATPAPATTGFPVLDCWVTNQASNWDPGAKIYQSPAGYPTFYLVSRLSAVPGTDLTATETVYDPYGRQAWTTSWTWTGRYQSWSRGLRWNGYAQGGKWLFRIDLTNGASCQYVVNVVR